MRVKDKLALQRFRELSLRISEATEDRPVHETPTQKDARIKRLLGDYNAFVRYYFPHYASSDCADFHVDAAEKIRKDKYLSGVFEWPRGHAKSTHLDIMIPMWLKALKELRVMVLVGKSQKSAHTLIGDLQAELQNNQRYIDDFGPQMRIGSWEEGRFVTQDDCAFFALGRGQSPRGLRHRQFRPDYIAIDDIDDDELVQNPDRVRKLVDWCLTALYFAMDMGKGRFILVGNRIAENSVLAEMAKEKDIYHSVIKALDDNGQPVWHQKYTLEDIQRIIRKNWRRAQKELFHNPIIEGAVFRHEWIHWGPIPALHNFDAIVSYCDPSFKNSSTSDYKAVITLGRYQEKIYVIGAFVRKCSVTELVRWWYDFHETLPDGVVAEYYMEANFIQDLIFDEFVKEGMARRYQLPLRPDRRNKPDKFARVESISPYFERGLFVFDESQRKNEDMKTFIEQLLNFEKGSRANDDAPDACEGAVYQLNRSSRKVPERYVFGQRPNRKF